MASQKPVTSIELPAVRKRAFTLIELLVVIAIIALLVSILMPSLQQAKELAERAKCGLQLRTIGLAINLYSEDNDDWMPFGRYAYIGPALEWYDGTTQRLGLLYAKVDLDEHDAAYIDDRKAFFCPGKKYPGVDMDTATWCGYSYCVPNSGFAWGGTSGERYICYKRDMDHPGWPTWMAGGTPYGIWAPYVQWVACERADGTFPPQSPHRNIGANVVYRDASVKFVIRPETGWGNISSLGENFGFEFGNWSDHWPFWAVVGKEGR